MTAGDPVLVDSAPSERAPAPVPVEWAARSRTYRGVFVCKDRRTADRVADIYDDTLVAVLPAADYDRMAAALALLATVDVTALKETLDYFDIVARSNDNAQPKCAAIRTVIAAIETATRATQDGG